MILVAGTPQKKPSETPLGIVGQGSSAARQLGKSSLRSIVLAGATRGKT